MTAGTSMFGHNAASAIARASPLGPLNDIAILPADVLVLMRLAEPVALVRARGDLVFHMAEKRGFRGDTSVYPWLFASVCAMVAAPTHYMAEKGANKHRVLGLVSSSPPEHPSVAFLSVILKFVPSTSPLGSGSPDLWISTITPHSHATAARYLGRAIRVGA